MNPAFVALGIVDILAGACILSPQLAGSFLFYVALYSLAKGIFSLIISFGAGYYADWLGFADVVTGAVLALMSFNVSFGFFYYIGIFAIVKGLYCTALPLIYK